MSLPFTESQCFFVAILVFMVVGFIRGWKRELVSLVFILLAVFLVTPQTSNGVSGFFTRLPGIVAYLTNQPIPPQQSVSNSPLGFLSGPFWSLVIFVGLVALGYYIGNRVFPKPGVPQDRLIGIIPAIVAGAFVLAYLRRYFQETSGQANVRVEVQPPDPGSFIAVMFVIALVALVGALIAARMKKAPAKK